MRHGKNVPSEECGEQQKGRGKEGSARHGMINSKNVIGINLDKYAVVGPLQGPFCYGQIPRDYAIPLGWLRPSAKHDLPPSGALPP